MSYLLPHLHSGWAVDQAILCEEERLVVIRFGHDWDDTCMQMDEVLASVAETIKNFAVIYLVDITEVTTIRLIGLSETNKSSLISLKLSSVVQGKDVVLSSLPKITLPNTATNFVLTYEPQKTRYETNTDMSNTGHAFNLKCWCYISKLWILLLYHLSCDSKNVPNSFSLYHVTTFVLQKLNYCTVGQRDVCLLLP